MVIGNTLSVGETVQIRVDVNDADTNELTARITTEDTRITTVSVDTIRPKTVKAVDSKSLCVRDVSKRTHHLVARECV